MVIDDKDKDEDYKPQEDEQDDEDYQMLDDDDDDFQEPLPQVRKPVKKEQLKKHSTQRRIDKSSKEDTADIDDETLSLFQKIVGDNFEIKASEEFEQERKDRCINPVEAAGFKATMKTLALELKKAVKKRKRVKEIYTDMIESMIKIATAMKYPGASTVETEEILASIKDINCNAWRKHLQGKTTMEPADMVLEEDNEEPPNEDILIEQPMLGKEATDAAAEAIKNLPKMLMADTNKKLRTLFNEMEKAHRHAAEASKTLRELHDDLPLDVFLRIADCAVRPLVILHIPKTESLIQRLKKSAVERMQRITSGSTNVVDVMVLRNLPICGEWTTEDDYKPRKMIASLVHKYVHDAMFKEQTAMQVIVDEFKLPKTTIHRQIYGKKYPGGGQKLEKL